MNGQIATRTAHLLANGAGEFDFVLITFHSWFAGCVTMCSHVNGKMVHLFHFFACKFSIKRTIANHYVMRMCRYIDLPQTVQVKLEFFGSCASLRCRFKWFWQPNDFPHKSQMNVESMCVLLCLLRECSWVNFSLHLRHSYCFGSSSTMTFSSVCSSSSATVPLNETIFSIINRIILGVNYDKQSIRNLSSISATSVECSSS